MKNIGIMGGTFNPIHIGHLIAAEEVSVKMGLDNIIFIPTGNPPHKNKNIILPALHRLEMVNLAIKNNDKFQISEMEINREGKTYTYDTLLELHNLYSDSELFFIIGYDTLKELGTWRSIGEVCKLCSFIVVNRNNDRGDMEKSIKENKEKYNAKIHIVDIPNIEVSSTDIRSRKEAGESIKYLVPESVENYIIKNDLYSEVCREGI